MVLIFTIFYGKNKKMCRTLYIENQINNLNDGALDILKSFESTLDDLDGLKEYLE